MIVDLYAGAGGWSCAARRLGLDTVGIEVDAAACDTRRAAGLATIRADLHHYRLPATTRLDGLIASPPCTIFSQAGSREGSAVLADLIADLETGGWAWPDGYPPDARLLWTVADWWDRHRPRWVALEQVRPVLPFWEALARRMRSAGWSAWTGILDAADYGIVVACPGHSREQTRPGSVASAEAISRCATALAIAEGPATTRPDAAPWIDAVTAVALWGRAIEQACAAAATPNGRLRTLVAQLASEAPTTPHGRGADAWTSEATSVFGPTPATDESIGLSLSASWDELYQAGKLSTTSTAIPPTTIRRILRSIAATLTTGPHTGPARRSAGCGLCVDIAVPQNRERAILIAHRDRQVGRPEPTHGRNPHPVLFGPTLEPWVSMADALGWPDAWEIDTRRDQRDGRTQTRGLDRPAPIVGTALNQWVLNRREGERNRERDLGQPAPTVTTSAVDRNWCWDRPSTTVTTDARIHPPGHKINQGDVARFGQAEAERRYAGRSGKEAVRVTPTEAAILQSFPPGWPWQGSKTSQARQIGNAVPPLLAYHVLATVLDAP